MKKKTNITEDENINYWKSIINQLEKTGVCTHEFSVKFTTNEKIEYCKKMITRCEDAK